MKKTSKEKWKGVAGRECVARPKPPQNMHKEHRDVTINGVADKRYLEMDARHQSEPVFSKISRHPSFQRVRAAVIAETTIAVKISTCSSHISS